jgi:hypothetical protein
MKVLVTGAGGFIGAQLVGLLQSEGRVGGRAIETLVGLDHRLRQGQGGVLAIEGELAGPEVRQRIAALAPDLCFHLAAVPGGATGPDATAWWMSARRCAQNLVHAAAMAVEDREARGRAWPLPVLRLSIAQVVRTLSQVHGVEGERLVRYAPQAAVEAVFGRYPALEDGAARSTLASATQPPTARRGPDTKTGDTCSSTFPPTTSGISRSTWRSRWARASARSR